MQKKVCPQSHETPESGVPEVIVSVRKQRPAQDVHELRLLTLAV